MQSAADKAYYTKVGYAIGRIALVVFLIYAGIDLWKLEHLLTGSKLASLSALSSLHIAIAFPLFAIAAVAYGIWEQARRNVLDRGTAGRWLGILGMAVLFAYESLLRLSTQLLKLVP